MRANEPKLCDYSLVTVARHVTAQNKTLVGGCSVGFCLPSLGLGLLPLTRQLSFSHLTSGSDVEIPRDL